MAKYPQAVQPLSAVAIAPYLHHHARGGAGGNVVKVTLTTVGKMIGKDYCSLTVLVKNSRVGVIEK